MALKLASQRASHKIKGCLHLHSLFLLLPLSLLQSGFQPLSFDQKDSCQGAKANGQADPHPTGC